MKFLSLRTSAIFYIRCTFVSLLCAILTFAVPNIGLVVSAMKSSSNPMGMHNNWLVHLLLCLEFDSRLGLPKYCRLPDPQQSCSFFLHSTHWTIFSICFQSICASAFVLTMVWAKGWQTSNIQLYVIYKLFFIFEYLYTNKNVNYCVWNCDKLL